MTKTHLTTGSDIACHRFAGTRTRKTADWRRVSCLDCQKATVYTDAVVEATVKAAEAFANQTPRQFEEPWGKGRIVCRKCQGDLFRSNGRTLDHYLFVCAECGETTQRLTETGMSA